MPFPPRPECVLESPNRQQLPSSKSSGTPRVGMHLYQNDEEDDVSVLTFHTMGAKDNTIINNHVGGGSSSFVKSARESLERLILESKNTGEDDDGKSLSRISEEGGSQMSSCHSKKGYDRSPSSKLSQTKSDDKNNTIDEHEDVEKGDTNDDDDIDYGDDDTISLAESILDSANKVLSSIGSSPYYSRGKKQSPPTDAASPSQPSTRGHSSPKQPDKTVGTNSKDKERSKDTHSLKDESPVPRKTISDENTQPEGASKFLNSYFHGENTNPTHYRSFHREHITGGERDVMEYGNENNGLKNTCSPKDESLSTRNTSIDKDTQPAASADFLSSYLRDKMTDNNLNNSMQSTKLYGEEKDDKENDTDNNVFSAKKECTTSKKMFSNMDNQLEVSSNFLGSYFGDHAEDEKKGHLNHSKNIRIQKLESERKHLQSLLEERQFETRRASQSLGSSIKRANELLERLSADRRN